ncbi:MAG: shikimate kinase [Candidatus Omnitrophota bacterium]
MDNITLIGFMGTGKTETAKMLAVQTNRKYISVDDAIEKKEAQSISDIFQDKGEPYFRKIEKETIREISSHDGQVIDAGGGAVLDEENMKNLSSCGLVVCLWAEPEEIYERVKKDTHRPLLKADDPLRKIKDLLEKRRPFYKKASIHIDTTGMRVKSVAKKIKEILDDKTNV